LHCVFFMVLDLRLKINMTRLSGDSLSCVLGITL
jgi:hypothetical protein